jgi:hypothetical protein
VGGSTSKAPPKRYTAFTYVACQRPAVHYLSHDLAAWKTIGSQNNCFPNFLFADKRSDRGPLTLMTHWHMCGICGSHMSCTTTRFHTHASTRGNQTTSIYITHRSHCLSHHRPLLPQSAEKSQSAPPPHHQFHSLVHLQDEARSRR